MTTRDGGGGRRGHPPVRLTQWRVVVSEWIKLRSLRSTLYTLASAVVTLVGFGALAAGRVTGQLEGRHGGGPSERFGTDATSISLAGLTLTQMIIGVLGVLLISGEYSTGMIRSSLTAVPTRLPVLWAKVLVLCGVVGSVMLAAVLAAFFASRAVLAGKDMDVALTADGVLGALVGAAAYLTGVGVLGMALGALLRSTAGAISTLFAVLLVVPGLLGLVLPARWGDAVGPYLPSNAGQSFTTAADTGAGLLAPTAGVAVFLGYLVVLLAAAALALMRRDA